MHFMVGDHSSAPWQRAQVVACGGKAMVQGSAIAGMFKWDIVCCVTTGSCNDGICNEANYACNEDL